MATKVSSATAMMESSGRRKTKAAPEKRWDGAGRVEDIMERFETVMSHKQKKGALGGGGDCVL